MAIFMGKLEDVLFSQKNSILETGKNGEDKEETLQAAIEGNALQVSATDKGNGVNLTISEEALEMYKEQAKASDEAADAMKDMAKLMEIARRIANGDKVPATDEKKLMEFNSDLYQAAKAAAILNQDKDHKEYESMYEEEKKRELEEQLRHMKNEDGSESVNEQTPVESAPIEGIEAAAPVTGGDAVSTISISI